jgi:predicted acetyltransferase
VSIEIRTASPDDYAAAVETISTAFLDRPDTTRIAEQLQTEWEPERTWLAFDGPRVVGTFRSWPTEITVPGLQRLPAAAVAAVTVLPTHRRQGILTRLAASEHAAMRDRGEALSLLYASEFPIYGRFGYGPATRHGTWTVTTTRTTLVPGDDKGSIELVTADEAVRDAVIDLYDRWRVSQPGEIRRRRFTWDYRLGLAEEAWDRRWKGWIALHRDEGGGLDGFLRYSVDAKWEGQLPSNQLVVRDLFGLDDVAERGLWAHLLSVDLVATVRAGGRSTGDRLPWWLTNARAAQLTDVTDGIWVRIFDVPRALAARTYERTASVVLEVVDDAARGGAWRVGLDASPDGATCSSTERSPDLTIPVRALGSAYLGTNDLRDIVLRTGVDEHTPGALASTAAAFRTLREPWCSTFF